jgi:hypothetical protein
MKIRAIMSVYRPNTVLLLKWLDVFLPEFKFIPPILSISEIVRGGTRVGTFNVGFSYLKVCPSHYHNGLSLVIIYGHSGMTIQD